MLQLLQERKFARDFLEKKLDNEKGHVQYYGKDQFYQVNSTDGVDEFSNQL